MPITLTVVRGPLAGREFAFDRHDTFLVGRSKDAHLSIPDDPYFSRHHLLIEANPPLCRLTDLNSRNGTLVNGTRVESAELKDGDEISGGETVLKVAVGEAGDAVTPDLPPATPPDPGASAGTLPECGAIDIPGYRQLLEMGRGGMGVAYRGVRNADGAAVAVKTVRPVLAPLGDEVVRFLREAEVLGSLAHPRIIRTHETGEANGLLYLVTDLVNGPDAGRLVRERGPLPVPLALELVGQLCEVLAFAHGKGFAHRDVKPGNVLLDRAGAGWEVRLADFGLAGAYQETRMSGLTISGEAAATPAFTPPERVTDFHSAKPAADQYAAGATAYYLLTGGVPFAGASTAEMLRRILAGTPDRVDARRREVPKGVADAIHRAMATKPADRFSDVAAFAAALRSTAR